MKKKSILIFAIPHLLLAFQSGPPTSAPVGPPRTEDRLMNKIGESSNCGVAVSGSMALGRTTSSTSLISIRNRASKAIAAIVGATTYSTSEGTIVRKWSAIYPSPVDSKSYFQPGVDRAMPGFPENVTSPNGSISSVLFDVSGVLFADGTKCGEEADSASEKFLANMKYWTTVFTSFQREADKYSSQDLENKLRAGYYPQTDGPLANEGLRRTFISPSTGKLVPEYKEKLAIVLSHLANPFLP